MILMPELAQKIAYKTTAILGHNVNIMNSAGIIIGSGDKQRLNCFHEGAFEVIKTGISLEISIEDSHKLQGAKPGVNLPISFNDKIVGVVGITGSPDEVRQYGQLLTMLVETLLNQHFLTEQGRLEMRAKENFILDILRFDSSYSEDLIVDRGKALGYDIFLPRIAIAVLAEELEQHIFNGDNVTTKMELNIQKLKDDIFDSADKVLEKNRQNLMTFIKGNILLLLKVAEHNDIATAAAAAKMVKLSQKIQEILKTRRGLTVTIGIGSFHEGIFGLKKTYQQAIESLAVGKKLRGPGHIYQYEELSLGVMLNSLSREHKQQYIQYFEKQKNLAEFLNDTLLETLEKLFETSFNISETARLLYIHRNTLVYRLEKIRKITGLNPVEFNDALQLKMYIMIRKLQ